MTVTPTDQTEPWDLRVLVRQHAELRDAMLAQREPAGAYAAVTAVAVDRVPGADVASITRAGASFESLAPTGELATRADRMQYELGHGPCVEAATDDGVFVIGELATDLRWGEFGPRAARELGVHSMLSMRLYIDDNERSTALNLYSREPDAFDAAARTITMLLASLAVTGLVAITERARADNLNKAVTSNRRIGTAMGIIMATAKVTQEQAFDLLRIASQRSHRKLADIAYDVVETGTLALDPP